MERFRAASIRATMYLSPVQAAALKPLQETFLDLTMQCGVRIRALQEDASKVNVEEMMEWLDGCSGVILPLKGAIETALGPVARFDDSANR